MLPNPEFQEFPLEIWSAGIRELCQAPDGAVEVYAPASHFVLKAFPKRPALHLDNASRLSNALNFLRLKWEELEAENLVGLDSSGGPRIGDNLIAALHTAFMDGPVETLTKRISVPLIVRLAKG